MDCSQSREHNELMDLIGVKTVWDFAAAHPHSQRALAALMERIAASKDISAAELARELGPAAIARGDRLVVTMPWCGVEIAFRCDPITEVVVVERIGEMGHASRGESE